MEQIIKYSGTSIILSSIFLVVIPFLELRIKSKAKLISDAASLGGLGRVVRFGMVVSGILIYVFSNNVLAISSNIRSGSVLLIKLSAASLILGGIITKKIHKILHNIFVYSFYILLYVGLVYFSITSQVENIYGAMFILTTLIGGLGSLFLYLKKKFSNSEIWGIVFADLVVLMYYFFI